MTTAYRLALYLRKRGKVAEVVEHRRGKLRFDLLGVADVMAYWPGSHMLCFYQTYEWRDRMAHLKLNAEENAHIRWMNRMGRGVVFFHAVWRPRIRGGRKVWGKPTMLGVSTLATRETLATFFRAVDSP